MRCPACTILFWKDAAMAEHYGAEFLKCTILTEKYTGTDGKENYHITAQRGPDEHSLHNTLLCAKCSLALRMSEEGHGTLEDREFYLAYKKSKALAKQVWRERCEQHQQRLQQQQSVA
jgi:hypothetical protein